MNRKLFDRYLGEAGYPSIAEMCRDTGMLPVTISKILNGGYPILPRQKNEGYSKAVEDLCCVLCCEPDELFGDDLRKTVRHTDLSSEFSEYMFDDPFENLREKKIIDVVAEKMSELTKREETVLKMRYGISCESSTLDQAGEVVGGTRERIRQIEAKAISKMRHPQRSSLLRQLKVKTIQRDIEQPRDSFFDVEEPLPPVKIIKPKPKKERAKPGTK